MYVDGIRRPSPRVGVVIKRSTRLVRYSILSLQYHYYSSTDSTDSKNTRHTKTPYPGSFVSFGCASRCLHNADPLTYSTTVANSAMVRSLLLPCFCVVTRGLPRDALFCGRILLRCMKATVLINFRETLLVVGHPSLRQFASGYRFTCVPKHIYS